jgi:putative heme-binding domain-containing protein
LERLLLRDLDGQDLYLPLLLWWAVEQHALPAREQVLSFFAAPAAWRVALIRDAILDRLMRRYAAEGTKAGYTACARLLATACTADDRRHMLAALDQGLRDQPRETPLSNRGTLFTEFADVESQLVTRSPRPHKIPEALEEQVAKLWTNDPSNPTLLSLLVRLGRSDAQNRAVALATQPSTPLPTRLALLQVLAEAGPATAVGPLLQLLASREPDAVQRAALDALEQFDQMEVATALLRIYPQIGSGLRARAVDLLVRRKRWARALLQAVDQGALPGKDIAVEQLRPIALHHDRLLDALVRKHWGSVQRGTPEEKLAEMRRLSNDLRAGSGNPVLGQALFKKHCAICHKLFGEGNTVGPDLTHANRKDRDFLLASIVDPSAIIRKEYLSFVVQTTDGRVLTGLIAEQTSSQLTLLDAKNERTVLARSRIESIEESAVSLMPENLLKGLTPEEVRDLFGYLQK